MNVMDTIVLFAWIMILFSLIKMLIILVNPDYWINFAKRFWKYPAMTGLISTLLAGLVLFYLLQDLSIVDIFAVMLFISLIFISTLSSIGNEYLEFSQKLAKKPGFWNKFWFAFIIWFALIIYCLIIIW